MGTFKHKILNNWHLMRIFRLVIGIWILIVAIHTRDWIVGIFSAFFLYQAVTDTGCCGSQGCYTFPNKKDIKSAESREEVGYEEVK